jgi:hypothetical protein
MTILSVLLHSFCDKTKNQSEFTEGFTKGTIVNEDVKLHQWRVSSYFSFK